VLQDGHWSAGLFGYFPTYTMGNLYAAQLWAAARAALPGLDDELSAGRSDELLAWLRAHVHAHAATRGARDWLAAERPFLVHLRARLAEHGVIACLEDTSVALSRDTAPDGVAGSVCKY